MTIFSILAIAFIPGIPLAAALSRKQTPLAGFLGLAGSLGIAWTIFYSYVATFFHVGLYPTTIYIPALIPATACLAVPYCRKHSFEVLKNISFPSKRLLLIYPLIVLFLMLPLVTIHRQLPTGDIQKAIYWAENVLDKNTFPDYQRSLELNRDPSDFLTPGLHTLTASVIRVGGDKFASAAWFSFWAGMILAALGVALTSLITDNAKTHVLVFFFAATNIRFLRYVFYPGYHFQNLIGEILLVSAFYLFLFAIAKWQTTHQFKKIILPAVATFFLLLLLPLVHQFSAFLAAFVAFGIIVTLIVFFHKRILPAFNRHRKISGAIALIVATILTAVIFFSPLTNKLSAIFNFQPHLKPFTIQLPDYPSTFGVTLFLLGVAGIVVTYLFSTERKKLPRLLIAAYCLVFLILGQGSNLFIDIPSARTLFYAGLPLSIFAGLFLSKLTEIGNKSSFQYPLFISIAIVVAVATHANSASVQLSATGHTTRVNASLTTETLDMLSFLEQMATDKNENFLIDDWNRRRLTWGIISPFNMITRIGGDFGVIGQEAKQSELRKRLYDTGLEYEKIFMLGNNPIAAKLLAKNNVKFIGTAAGASAETFKHNPYLTAVFTNTETTLYSFQAPSPDEPKDNQADFLLQSATIANDVGDTEDLEAYSAISITATRISEPMFRDERSLREIQSADGTIRFNVGNYILPHWDNNRTGKIEIPLKFLLRLKNNGASTVIKFNGKEIANVETKKSGKYTDETVIIPAGTLGYNNKGFIHFDLNIKNGPLILDLVAIGPSKQEQKND